MSNYSKETTLFLIDDDDVDAMTVERALLSRRIINPIVRAKDGLDALEMLENNQVKKPFITLLDLKMPRMNGIEFLQHIRTTPNLKDMVVFVLSTSNTEEDITATYEHSIAGYFLKENAGEGFLKVVDMLEGYWKIVCLPKD